MSDDGFINVRVVENLFNGHGPVFNVGERVEVGTSTLWLVVLSVGHAVTPFWGVSTLAVVTGLVASVVGLATATRGAVVLWRASGRCGLALPLGTVALAALPPMWDFATSGLETGLIFLWLGGSFLLLSMRLVRGEPRAADLPAWRPLWPAIVIGLGPLVRPDLALISLAFGVALIAQSRRSAASWLGAAAAAAVIPAGYEVLRAGYYASLVPNTALAKSAGDSAWEAGMTYLGDYAGLYLLVVPLLAVMAFTWGPQVVCRLRARDVAASALFLAPVAGGLMHGLYVVRVGGDFMHARFLLPATFAVLMPVAGVVLPSTRRSLAVAAVPIAVVAVWALGVGTSVRLAYPGAIGPHGIADERGVYVTSSGSDNPVRLGDWSGHGWLVDGSGFRERAAAGERFYVDVMGGQVAPVADGRRIVVRIRNIGVFGTAAGEDILVADSLALADAVGSRLELPAPEEVRAGHSQVIPPEWHLARYSAPSPDEPRAVADARAALACGQLKQLQEAITAPMTPARFFQNLVAAPGLTTLSVPGDAAEARAKFCR